MKTIEFDRASDNLESLLDRAIEDADYTIVRRAHAGDAVIMSLDTFNSLLETLHLLKSPENAAHLERAIAQYERGQVAERELLSE
ncbi:MAG: type II toxin-antitoxin system prevent-host-death family antitoxin [Cyanobacteria bacterium J06639_1]